MAVLATSPKQYIKQILSVLNTNMYERDQIIGIALLGILAGQNIFFLGPPGTGKSMISRRISQIFKNVRYFEYLMQKFSTPEDIFGPISLKALKDDEYKRLTRGYLPDAEIVFLDEIWKANAAILNSLLTAINEKVFKNGTIIQKIPLMGLITASNECPDMNSELAAIFDRFNIRLFVPEIKNGTNFRKLIAESSDLDDFSIPEELLLDSNQIDVWKKEIRSVKISEDTQYILQNLRESLRSSDLKIYISDRRWIKAAYLLKASAFFNNREETNLADLLILKSCLWNTEEEICVISEIVDEYFTKIDVSHCRAIIKTMENYRKKIVEKRNHSKSKDPDRIINGRKLFTVKINDNEIYVDPANGKAYELSIKNDKETLSTKYSVIINSKDDIWELYDKKTNILYTTIKIPYEYKINETAFFSKEEYKIFEKEYLDVQTEYREIMRGIYSKIKNVFIPKIVTDQILERNPDIVNCRRMYVEYGQHIAYVKKYRINKV